MSLQVLAMGMFLVAAQPGLAQDSESDGGVSGMTTGGGDGFSSSTGFGGSITHSPGSDVSAFGSAATGDPSSATAGYGGMSGDLSADDSTSFLDAPDGEAGLIRAPRALGGSADAAFKSSTMDGANYGFLPEAGQPQPNQLLEANRAAPLAANALPIGPMIHSPVVVELFTSQGCSSCPAADDMLADLANRSDVLALSWHVDYWDYLGWSDDFARPEFTVRQKNYARAAGERSIYTPQILVGGTDTLLSLRPADLMSLIETEMARPIALSVVSQDTPDGFKIELTPRGPSKHGIAILLIRYAPARQVEVKSGENRGLTLTYRNIVLGVDRIATWDGRQPLRLKVSSMAQPGSAYPPDTRHALIAQQIGRKDAASGAILAAIKLD
ncbi:DUF1223 domain-containing protein [Paracoccus aminophilus]|nr:DUF1223 domain-containing protein [Paracoccus aminophilus]